MPSSRQRAASPAGRPRSASTIVAPASRDRPDLFGQREAVHLRHLASSRTSGKASPRLAPLRMAIPPARRLASTGFMRHRREHRLEDPPVDRVVVDDEDRHVPRGARLRLACGGSPAEAKRHGEVERAALAGLALHPDAAAHQLDEADEIARPRPVPPYLRVVEPSAWANGSKIARCLSGDADAGVANREVQHGAPVGLRSRSFDAQDHLAALGELDGVADQVDEDLAQPARVADQRRRDVGAMSQASSRPFLVRPRRQSLGASITRVAQIEVDRVDVELARPRSSRSRGCR